VFHGDQLLPGGAVGSDVAMGFLNLWVLLGALVVTLGIAIFGGGGVLWVLPAITVVVIVVLTVWLRRTGSDEDESNRLMNAPPGTGHR
jgi:hypothetical protein